MDQSLPFALYVNDFFGEFERLQEIKFFSNKLKNFFWWAAKNSWDWSIFLKKNAHLTSRNFVIWFHSRISDFWQFFCFVWFQFQIMKFLQIFRILWRKSSENFEKFLFRFFRNFRNSRILRMCESAEKLISVAQRSKGNQFFSTFTHSKTKAVLELDTATTENVQGTQNERRQQRKMKANKLFSPIFRFWMHQYQVLKFTN